MAAQTIDNTLGETVNYGWVNQIPTRRRFGEVYRVLQVGSRPARLMQPVFGGAQYADRIARLRLRQAYGRLIRRADDRGVFVMLDRALPSRLLSAFPEGVAITRLPLAEAADATAQFLESSQP